MGPRPRRRRSRPRSYSATELPAARGDTSGVPCGALHPPRVLRVWSGPTSGAVPRPVCSPGDRRPPRLRGVCGFDPARGPDVGVPPARRRGLLGHGRRPGQCPLADGPRRRPSPAGPPDVPQPGGDVTGPGRGRCAVPRGVHGPLRHQVRAAAHGGSRRTGRRGHGLLWAARRHRARLGRRVLRPCPGAGAGGPRGGGGRRPGGPGRQPDGQQEPRRSGQRLGGRHAAGVGSHPASQARGPRRGRLGRHRRGGSRARSSAPGSSSGGTRPGCGQSRRC